MIFTEMFIRNLFSINKKNLSLPIIFRKKTLLSFDNILNRNLFNKVIWSNILNKIYYVNKLIQEETTYSYVVSQNDILSKILIEYNNKINFSDINLLMQQYPILRNLKPGQIISWVMIADKNLQRLMWNVFPKEIRVYNRISTNFTEGIIRIVNESNNSLSGKVLFIGMLSGTFIDSARSLGISENYIMDIIHALRYQLDFRKLHEGDKFAILTSVIINDNSSVRSRLIGARLNTSGKDYYIFRANNGKFYDHNAVRLGKDFMQLPTSKSFRISSNFNLHRLHPVTKQISPHIGVDFAMPMDTPVLAVGDGEVIVSAYNKIAGNYIVIQHNYHCITRYMHLNKLLVKPGQQVKCGASIALSGNTGRSTGPHLHFEIWMNHRPVNPLTAKILNIEKLLGKERAIYFKQIDKILPQLCFD